MLMPAERGQQLKSRIMKKALILLLLPFSLFSYSQEYWDYDINFDDPNELFRINIDTILYPNNIWEIGAPQKSSFNNAYSSPNVIITDTINTYPPSDTSAFVITHVTNDGFLWPHTVILSGYYKCDSDSLNDYGLIEFSPDNGETWIDLINDTIYSQYICWDYPIPVLTGNINEWTYFYAWLAELGLVFNINYGDTVLYRFTFISDQQDEQRDGLMYDDLHFEDWAEIIDENSNSLFQSTVFPNPASMRITIDFKSNQNDPFVLKVFNSHGQQLYNKQYKNGSDITITTRDYPTGLYIYQLTNMNKNKSSVGKFIINK